MLVAGGLGDTLHAVLYAAGYNIRWLLRAIVRLGIPPIFLRLLFKALRNVRKITSCGNDHGAGPKPLAGPPG